MRLRAIVLCVIALAGFGLRARAQSFSNTLTLQPGYNAITVPLKVGSNRVTELFPVLPNDSILVKYIPGSGYVINSYSTDFNGWESEDGFAGTLRPGEGAFLYIPTPAPFTLTVFGEKPNPTALSGITNGFNLVGSQKLEPVGFEELMGFAPRIGDAVYHFDEPLAGPGGTGDASRTNRFTALGWDVTPIIPPHRAVFVNVASEPRVMIDPPRQAVPAGGRAEFRAVTVGVTATNYVWRFNGMVITGQVGQVLTIQPVNAARAGNYSVVAQFSFGSVTSLNARLTVIFPPVITNQTLSLTVTQGGTARFFAQAAGTPPLYYQWMRDGNVATPFAVDRTNYFIPNVPASAAGIYYVIVTNGAGAVTSAPIQLNVLVPPTIVTQPQGAVVNVGERVQLFVDADGTQPLMYQWLLNGNVIDGVMGPLLVIDNVQPGQAGIYRVIVANAVGAVLSAEAMIMVVGGDVILNDMFPGDDFFTTPNGAVQAINLGATPQPGEPRHAGKPGGSSVWANYISSQPGIVTFRTRGSSIDTLLAAYLGSDVVNLSEVASDDDSGGFLSSLISFSVQPGVVYRIAIDGHNGAQGKFVLSWNFEPTPEISPIITLHPRNQVVASGGIATFTVNVQGPFDRLEWLFNGTIIPGSINQLTLAVPTSVTNPLQRIGPYRVRVHFGNRYIESRVADLEVRQIDGPGQPPTLRAYDKFEDMLAALFGDPPGVLFGPASQVLGFTGSQAFSTAGSGGQNGEPIHCGVIGGHSKWYAYIPPAHGTLFLNTDGSSFDTILAAYTGCCTFGTLTPVSCDNNSGTNGLTSSISFPATSNTVYFIAVDGVGGVTGTVNLNYRLLVPMAITNLSSTTNSLTFQLNATPLWPFSVLYSTNFVTWTNLLTTNSATGFYTFTDTNLPPGRRYYRGRQAP